MLVPCLHMTEKEGTSLDSLYKGVNPILEGPILCNPITVFSPRARMIDKKEISPNFFKFFDL